MGANEKTRRNYRRLKRKAKHFPKSIAVRAFYLNMVKHIKLFSLYEFAEYEAQIQLILDYVEARQGFKNKLFCFLTGGPRVFNYRLRMSRMRFKQGVLGKEFGNYMKV